MDKINWERIESALLDHSPEELSTEFAKMGFTHDETVTILNYIARFLRVL